MKYSCFLFSIFSRDVDHTHANRSTCEPRGETTELRRQMEHLQAQLHQKRQLQGTFEDGTHVSLDFLPSTQRRL